MIAFIDSSALNGNYDSRDNFQGKATELMRKIAARSTEITSFMTTDHVLDEVVTLTRFAHSHRKAVELAEATLSSRFVTVVYSDEGFLSEGMWILRQHADKEWSFTDCVSLATMRKYGMGTFFTFDAHFRQAGSPQFPRSQRPLRCSGCLCLPAGGTSL